MIDLSEEEQNFSEIISASEEEIYFRQCCRYKCDYSKYCNI
jgi:hypothetical protein